ncbi:MAG: hypothetical protein WA632_04040 [Gallionella sp.]
MMKTQQLPRIVRRQTKIIGQSLWQKVGADSATWDMVEGGNLDANLVLLHWIKVY